MAETGGFLRVGEVAQATGLTVRTLHYYDEIELVRPSHRTSLGHRGYTRDDLRRLDRVLALRRFGLGLGEVAACLAGDPRHLQDSLSRKRDEIRRQIDGLNRLDDALHSLLSRIAGEESADVAGLVDALTSDVVGSGVQRPIVALVYEDIEAACDHLERVFQLGPCSVMRDGDGTVVHAEVRCGVADVWMHRVSPEHGLASPAALGAGTATMVVFVDDVDAHYRYAVENGARIEHPPVDQEYGYREYSAFDAEGGLWAFLHPLSD